MLRLVIQFLCKGIGKNCSANYHHLLTLIFKTKNISESLSSFLLSERFPGIADLKMADLYLIVNFFYVFASLIEFAVVSYQPPEKAHPKKKSSVAPLQVIPPEESKFSVKLPNCNLIDPDSVDAKANGNGLIHLSENADGGQRLAPEM